MLADSRLAHSGLADSITASALYRLLGTDRCPVIVDVRRDAAFEAADHVLPAARRHTDVTARDVTDAPHGVVLYCVHGHHVSQRAAAGLRAEEGAAAWLEGGIAGWAAAGLPLIARAPDAAARFGAGTVWVTRRRPKIDRVACPWFIRRFVDDRARLLFVDPDQVLAVAEAAGGVAFDVEGAPVTHDGPRCSFDTLLDRYGVSDPTLRHLADIVRGADTGVMDGTREAGGLLSMSLGLSALESDDHVMLAKALVLYDALYAHLRFAAAERHSWPPAA